MDEILELDRKAPRKQGHAGAQFYLGLMYRTGEGGPKDGAEAARWYTKAAEQGNAMHGVLSGRWAFPEI